MTTNDDLDKLYGPRPLPPKLAPEHVTKPMVAPKTAITTITPPKPLSRAGTMLPLAPTWPAEPLALIKPSKSTPAPTKISLTDEPSKPAKLPQKLPAEVRAPSKHRPKPTTKITLR